MPYFCSMFNHSLTVNKSGELPVMEVPGTILDNMLVYIYRYKLNIDSSIGRTVQKVTENTKINNNDDEAIGYGKFIQWISRPCCNHILLRKDF